MMLLRLLEMDHHHSGFSANTQLVSSSGHRNSAGQSTSVAIMICSSCHKSIAQLPGVHRTMCPFCGNFYSNPFRRLMPASGAHGTTTSIVHFPRLANGSTDLARASRSLRRARFGDGICRFLHNFKSRMQPANAAVRSDSSCLSDDEWSDTPGETSGGRSSAFMHRSESEDSVLPPLIRDNGMMVCVRINRSRPSNFCRHNYNAKHRHHHEHATLHQDLSRHRNTAPRMRTSRTASSLSSADLNSQQPIAMNSMLINSVAALEQLIQKAAVAQDFSDVMAYYSSAFHSFADINAAFGVDNATIYENASRDAKPSSCLNLDLIQFAFTQLMKMPDEVQKAALKAVINSLLSDQRGADAVMMKPLSKDDLRAYFILVQNPQFRKPSTYVIFAHLMRQIATLFELDQKTLAVWFSEKNGKDLFRTESTSVKAPALRSTVNLIQQFISIRLFPPRPQDLPPMAKCSWWIPCAVRTLAILHEANDMKNQIIPFVEFYNESIDHWDLLQEYSGWEMPNNLSFSFCQYPFILSISAKRSIMETHAEQQMIATAQESIIGNIFANRTPDMDMLFLNISVRRQNLLQESLAELTKKQHHLRKKLRVRFAGEPGLDMGGLTKEWFQLLVKSIFQPDYGMFTYHTKSEVFWFCCNCDKELEKMREYQLVGILMGLAVYNGVILDIRFPPCCYKKLLSPPVIPRGTDLQETPLGVTQLSLDDLSQVMPDVANGLRQLLDYDGNVEADFGVFFQINVSEFDQVKCFELKENGNELPVTNENRHEYVGLYVESMLNRLVYEPFKAFYLGFHSVVASNVMLLLRAEEVDMLVCGSPDFDFLELKKVTTYDGFTAKDKTVRYFWELVLKLPTKHQKRLLHFVTGSDRIPAGGMKEMTFKICKMVSRTGNTPSHMLPMAHTCFNQLVLPDYQSRKALRRKLSIALSLGTEGFGLE